MRAYIKISKKVVTLSDKKALLYAVLSMPGNFGDVLPINYIARIIEVSNQKYINRFINSMESEGFITRDIKRTYKYGGNYSTSTRYFTIPSKEYYYMYTDVISNTSIPARVRGFFVRLCCLTLNDSLQIKISRQEIMEALKISRNTLKTRLAELASYGLIKEWDSYIQINEGMVPTRVKISPETKKKIKELLECVDTFKGKRVFVYYYNRRFEGLKMSLEKFLDYCIVGCPGINKPEEVNEKVVEEYEL